MDPPTPCVVRAHRLCRAGIRRLFCLGRGCGYCGSQQTFLSINVSLCAEFMVGSCVGLLRLLSGDDLADQGCILNHSWSVAVVQLGLYYRVRYT